MSELLQGILGSGRYYEEINRTDHEVWSGRSSLFPDRLWVDDTFDGAVWSGIPDISGISFSVSVIVNYILSLTFVFDTGKDKNKIAEFVIFVVLSVIGLGINQVLMWVCVEKLHIYYMISKIGVTGVVMVYNFITRKLILEKRES